MGACVLASCVYWRGMHVLALGGGAGWPANTNTAANWFGEGTVFLTYLEYFKAICDPVV